MGKMHEIQKTDVLIGKNVYASSSLLANQRSFYTLKAYTISKIVNEFSNRYAIPEQLKIRMSSIKGWARGYYYDCSKLILIDALKLTPDWFAYILVHELVHSNQYETGNMTNCFDSSSAMVLYEGKTFLTPNNPKHEIYRAWPWEVEARQKGFDLSKEFCAILNIPFNITFDEV